MSKASSDQLLSLSAAGRKFQLGMVYDAYTNKLFEDLILLKKCPDVGKRSRFCPSLRLDLKSSCTLKDRMEAFRFSGHVKVGVVFGLFKLRSASANYIHDISSSIGQARMTLHYKHTIRYEELDMATIQSLSCNYEMLKTAKERGATHFVAGMTFGNHVIIDFKFSKQHEKEHDLLDIQLKGLISCGQFLANKLNKDKTQLINVDDIQCKLFCESMDIKQPASFKEAIDIYENLPKILQNAEAVDCVYLLPLSIIDKYANKFKELHIDEVTMQILVDIRDDLYEQEMQCAAMEKRGIDTASRVDAIQKYTEDLKSALSSTNVERWNEEVVKHNSSKFQMQRFHTWRKRKIRAHTCSRCDRAFSTESELAEHIRLRDARSCHRCNKEFCSELAITQHLKTHEARTCRLCKEEFPTESDLAEHMRRKKVHPCHICKKEFYTKDEFLEHWVTCSAYTCRTCWKVFSTEREFTQHKEDVKARTCGRCNKELSSESELTEHMRNADAVPRCHCTVQCCTERDLANHKLIYHARTCHKCRKEFSTEEELQKHLSDSYARTCSNCQKECSTEEELAQHMRDAESLRCCKCTKDFCSERDLAAHMQIDHGSTYGTS